MRHVLVYSALRIALFAVIWWLASLTGLNWVFSGIIAAVIAMLLSIVLFGKQRQAMAVDIERRLHERSRRRAERRSDTERDADEEDAIMASVRR